MPITRIYINPPHGGGRLRSANLTSASTPAHEDQELIEELRTCAAEECYVLAQSEVILVTARVASERDERFIDSVVACTSRHGYEVDDIDKLFGRSA